MIPMIDRFQLITTGISINLDTCCLFFFIVTKATIVCMSVLLLYDYKYLCCIAAIKDPRPGYDFGKTKSYNFDYSYWSNTVSINSCCAVTHKPLLIIEYNCNVLPICYADTQSLESGLFINNIHISRHY